MPHRPKPRRTPAIRASTLALLAILSLGFTIRLIGIDWDEGRYMHPDERHIVADVLVGRIDISWPPSRSWLDPNDSPLNPRPQNEDGSFEGFAYGSFPVYLVDAIGGISERMTGVDWRDYQRAAYVGRALSILLDTGTILLVFLSATWLVGRYAALLAATLYAFAPVAIQASHFFTVDSWMTFFILAALYTSMRAADSTSVWQFLVASLWFGLALATKTTAAPIAGIILLGIVLAALADSARKMPMRRMWRRFTIRTLGSAAVATVVYFLGEPFAFLHPEAFLNSIRVQADIQSGGWDVPFTQQYVGTPRVVYHLEQATRYHLGPVLTLLGIAGSFGIAWATWKRRSRSGLLLTTWIIGFALVIVWPETKFPRYILPIVPAIAISAGFAVSLIAAWLRTLHHRSVALSFTVLMVLLSAGYGSAFATVTTAEHSRISASIWMFENLPPGSRSTSEVWDDRLPMSIGPGYSGEARRIDDASINLYNQSPTFGDIARLAPVAEMLPTGTDVSGFLRAGRVDDAVATLRSIGPVSLAAHQTSGVLVGATRALDGPARNTADSSRLSVTMMQAELLRAAAGMTTSPTLTRATQTISDTIGTSGEISASEVWALADAIETARDDSMVSRVYSLLENADYYVLASDRVQRGMVQNPWRRAVPIRMYQLLDAGTIGYTEIATFSSFPQLFGRSFPDATADETFINYDHPVVRIYAKDELVTFDRFVGLLGAAALMQSDPDRSPDTEPLTYDAPVSDLPAVFDARWSEALTGNSWGAAIVWIAMLIVLQVAALPLARTVFRSFPDAGWGLTRVTGLIVPATVLWLLASSELVHFRAVWVVVTMLLFALASHIWFRKHHHSVNRRLIGAAEAVFWVTFAIFLTFKLINPDSWHYWWGGEKPMEFAQINAILRSPTFPPVDPWYAQGYLNYYYYSLYLVAFMIKLTGIPTEFAFNLAQPTVMAMLAAGTFSVGAMLAARLSRGRQSGLLGGAIAVLLVSFAGNMRSVALLIEDIREQSGPIDPFMYWVWTPSRTIVDNGAQIITEFPYFAGLYGDLHSHVFGMVLVVFTVALGLTFAFDFNANGTTPTYQLARGMLTAIALGIVYPTNAWDLPVAAALIAASLLIGSSAVEGVRRRLVLVVGTAVPIAAGAFLVSLPFLLHFEALFGSLESTRSSTSLLELQSHVGGLLLVATATIPILIRLVAGRPLLLPFVPYAGLVVVLLARWLASERWPGLVQSIDVLTVLVVVAIWMLALPWQRTAARRLDFGLPGRLLPVIAAAGLAAVLALVFSDRLTVAVYIGIGTVATLAFLFRRPRSIRFTGLLMAGAAFTGAGVEFVFVADDLAASDWARMNTMFKFYNQIWILMAIVAGAAAGMLIMSLGGQLARGARSRSISGSGQGPVIATLATGAILLLASVFPFTATDARLVTRFEPRDTGLTLDAYTWMDFGEIRTTDGRVISFDEDRDVIDWFNTEVDGTPVIAEAAFGPYRCNSSRISNGTGLPSVLGWQRHQMQQRYPSVLPPRDADLRELYASENVDAKLAILARYDIRYVVVGELERIYPVISGNDCVPMSDSPEHADMDLDAGIGTFDQMVGETLEIAFQTGDTVIYRVLGNS